MQENSYHYPNMSQITIVSDGLVKLLKNLKTSKAAGPDDLAPTILKELSTEIAQSILQILAKSLHSHIIVPTDGSHIFKKARISPILRKPVSVPFLRKPVSVPFLRKEIR